MPRHFLEIDAATLNTRTLELAKRNVRDLVASRAMGLFFGDAGLGKSYGVEVALERLRTRPVWFEFPLGTNPKALLAGLIHALTGIEHSGTQAQLEREVLAVLRDGPRVLVIDEAQRLNHPCVEMLRHLHDQRDTDFALLLVGGNGCHDLIVRYPMLSSRIARWTKFSPLTIDEVRALIPGFHPLYERADPVLLEEVDDTFAHGNLRDWTSFTHTAAGIAAGAQIDYLDADVIEAALALIGHVEAA